MTTIGDIADGGRRVKTRHLYVNLCHDEAEVWCGDDNYFADLVEPTDKPREADCVTCLRVAADFGRSATRRLADIEYARRHGVTPAELDESIARADDKTITPVVLDEKRNRCLHCDSFVERIEQWREPTDEERVRVQSSGPELQVAKAVCRCGHVGLAIDWSIALDGNTKAKPDETASGVPSTDHPGDTPRSTG